MEPSRALRTAGVGLAGGLVYIAFFELGTALYTGDFGTTTSLITEAKLTTGSLYVAVGPLLKGGIPAVLRCRYDLVSPIVIVGGTAVAIWGLLWTYGSSLALASTFAILHTIGWPLVLGVALIAGWLEHELRTPF